MLKYQRTIAVSLLYSTSFHHNLPGQAWIEEHGEALLSLLTEAMSKYKGSVRLEMCDGLWASRTIAERGGRVGDGKLSAKIIGNMSIRLNTYTSSQRIVIPFI